MSDVALLWAIFFIGQACYFKDKKEFRFSDIGAYIMSMFMIFIYIYFEIIPKL